MARWHVRQCAAAHRPLRDDRIPATSTVVALLDSGYVAGCDTVSSPRRIQATTEAGVQVSGGRVHRESVTTRRRYGDRAELVARRAGVRAHSLRQQLTRRTIPLPARPREYLDPLLPRLCHLSRLFYAFTAGITSPSAAIPSATWLRNGALNPTDAIVISSPAAYFTCGSSSSTGSFRRSEYERRPARDALDT